MASDQGKGYETIFGVGLESTPGTPVAATEWYELLTENIRPEPEYLDLTGLTGARGSSTTSRRQGNIPVGGDVTMHTRQNLLGNWLYWAMGGGSGVSPSLDNNTLPSLTLECDKKIRKITTNGNKVGSLEMTSDTNGPLVLHPTFVGMGYTGAAGGITTPSYDDQDNYPILMHHGLTLTVGGSAIELHNLGLTILNNPEEGHFVNSQTRTAIPEGRREINLSLGLDWDIQTMTTRAVWTDFLAGNTASLIATYSDGSHSAAFTMGYVSYTGAPIGVDGPGAMTVDVSAVADDSGPASSDALVVVFA